MEVATVDPEPPEQHLGPDEWVDWIDRLAEEAPSRGLTWRDLARSTKDRLLGDPDMTAAEEALVAALWGGVDLSAPAGSIADDVGEAHLRDYCDEVCQEDALRDQAIAAVEAAGFRPLP